MIIDKLLKVSDDQSVTASAPSTDVIDFGQANPNTGMDNLSKMVITVSETATASGAATVSIALQDSANNSAWADVVVLPTKQLSDLKAGAQFVIPMPTKLRRYCRVNYTVGTGPLTAGKFSAQIVTGIQQNEPYPDGLN